MIKTLLNRTPKVFVCPYCGEKHKWTEEYPLHFYHSALNRAIFRCPNLPTDQIGNLGIYFENVIKLNNFVDREFQIRNIEEETICFYTATSPCSLGLKKIYGEISDFTPHKIKFRVHTDPIFSFDCNSCNRTDCFIKQFPDESFYFGLMF